MSNLLSLIGFGGSQNQTSKLELPELFSMPCLLNDFVKADIETIYARILTDVLERTDGVPDAAQQVLWDNCLASESKEGLVTMLSKAMYNKSDLFIVYRSDLGVIRPADQSEQNIIKEDYKKTGSSTTGIYVSFKNYNRTDMIKIYSHLEYYSVHSLYKSMNLAKAIQLKFKDLRASVGSDDREMAVADAKALAEALKAGKEIAMDGEDSVTTTTANTEAAEKATTFIDKKRCFYLGLPQSWMTGDYQKGLSDSGEGDAKAVERGLKGYFFSIIKPVCEALFGTTVSFRTDDFRLLSITLEALKTFSLIDDDLIKKEEQIKIVSRLLNIAEKDRAKAVTTSAKDVTPKPAVIQK